MRGVCAMIGTDIRACRALSLPPREFAALVAVFFCLLIRLSFHPVAARGSARTGQTPRSWAACRTSSRIVSLGVRRSNRASAISALRSASFTLAPIILVRSILALLFCVCRTPRAKKRVLSSTYYRKDRPPFIRVTLLFPAPFRHLLLYRNNQ